MRRALLYINSTGRESVDAEIQHILEKYCMEKEIEMFAVFCDDTMQEGIAKPTAYMAIGMSVDSEIDTVVTMCAGMLGNTENDVTEVLLWFRKFGIRVETVADDIAEYYEHLDLETDNVAEDADSASEFIKAIVNMYMR